MPLNDYRTDIPPTPDYPGLDGYASKESVIGNLSDIGGQQGGVADIGLPNEYELPQSIFPSRQMGTNPMTIIPLFNPDNATLAHYKASGALVLPVGEAHRYARMAQVSGMGSFWSGLWSGITWPFKTVWKGASWLVVQPIHGFKWVYNQAKKQYELIKEGEQANLPVVIPETKPSTMDLIMSYLKNPLVLGAIAALGWVGWRYYKGQPIIPQFKANPFKRFKRRMKRHIRPRKRIIKFEESDEGDNEGEDEE
jgi:hypothetical protein